MSSAWYNAWQIASIRWLLKKDDLILVIFLLRSSLLLWWLFLKNLWCKILLSFINEARQLTCLTNGPSRHSYLSPRIYFVCEHSFCFSLNQGPCEPFGTKMLFYPFGFSFANQLPTYSTRLFHEVSCRNLSQFQVLGVPGLETDLGSALC